MYEIKKAPLDLLDGTRNMWGIKLPLGKMEVGDMIEMENNKSNRQKCNNSIKSLKMSVKGTQDWKFIVRTIDEKIIACIRLS